MHRSKTVLQAGLPILVVVVIWQSFAVRETRHLAEFDQVCRDVFEGVPPTAPNPSIEQLQRWSKNALQMAAPCPCDSDTIVKRRLQLWAELALVAEIGLSNLDPLDSRPAIALLHKAWHIANQAGETQTFFGVMNPDSITHEATREAYLTHLAAWEEFQASNESQLFWHTSTDRIVERAGRLLFAVYPSETKRREALTKLVSDIAGPSTEVTEKLFTQLWDASLKFSTHGVNT